MKQYRIFFNRNTIAVNDYFIRQGHHFQLQESDIQTQLNKNISLL